MSLAEIIESLRLNELIHELPYERAKEQVSESWETKSGSVLTLQREGYELELVYDRARRLTGAIANIDGPDERARRDLWEVMGPKVEAYRSEEELVVFLPGDKAVHVLAATPGGSPLRIKVITPVSKAQRDLVCDLFERAELDEARDVLRRA